MTVKELIEELQEYDEDLTVAVSILTSTGSDIDTPISTRFEENTGYVLIDV